MNIDIHRNRLARARVQSQKRLEGYVVGGAASCAVAAALFVAVLVAGGLEGPATAPAVRTGSSSRPAAAKSIDRTQIRLDVASKAFWESCKPHVRKYRMTGIRRLPESDPPVYTVQYQRWREDSREWSGYLYWSCYVKDGQAVFMDREWAGQRYQVSR